MTRLKLLVMTALVIGIGAPTVQARPLIRGKFVSVRTATAEATLNGIGRSIAELRFLNQRSFRPLRNGARFRRVRGYHSRRAMVIRKAQSLKLRIIALQSSWARRHASFVPLKRPGVSVLRKGRVLRELGWMIGDLNQIIGANQSPNLRSARISTSAFLGRLQSKLFSLRTLVRQGSFAHWKRGYPRRTYGQLYR
ncbi:MAG: hypothetical protein KC609_19355 [Myxococcales bacterium]|nr:hypothetical protein [Myxococcales bacterium]